MGKKRLAMRGCAWWARSAVIAISLCGLPTSAVATGRMVRLGQNASEPGASESSQPPAAGAPAALSANSREQIRKAQIELRRLECLKGRVDGKLGEQTREAVKKYWASAKQPVVEVEITDALVSELAARGDLFCRPVRPFFGFGARPGGLPFFPGARPGAAPAVPAPPPPPEAAH
jgi:peptidoglycan hydrolase-like protein with peptidoglycan-binding domain